MKFVKFLLSFALFLSAFVGDYIVFKCKYSDSIAFRAISDSLVHGWIGFLSAALFFSYKLNVSTQACISYIMVCTVISSVIDIDHIFVAKSLNLKDLTNLKQRGLLHCTTFWTLFTVLLLGYSYTAKKLNVYTLTFMAVLAFTSHHVRDGNRRGLWMYPFGHTSPINKYVYASLLGLMPNLFAHFFVYMKKDYFKDVVEYITV